MKVKKCANKIKALNKKKGVLGFLFLLMSVSLMAQTNVDSLLNVLDEELIRSAHYETVKKQRIALIKENALKHNISLEEEYHKRVAEIRRLVSEMSFTHPVHIEEGNYDPRIFYDMAKGLEKVPEGGERCFKCYRLRMEEAARLAQKGNYDYFTTTLSISPLKNAEKINEIGEELAEIYKVPHLPSDFKKKNGYKRSIELSHEYDLYRQNYCGCVFSKREQEEKMK